MSDFQKDCYDDCYVKKPETCCYESTYDKKDDHYDKYDKHDKKAKCIKVPEVVGRNSCQVLLECTVPFPCQYPAVEIKDVMKNVKDLFIKVCKNKVLINGILHKNINYKTFEDSMKDKCDCHYNTFYGDVKHVSVEIPFNCFIEVPGAMPGDDYQIEFAGVEDCCEVDILEEPFCVPSTNVIAYKKVKEKVIVKIDLKVLRYVQITVKPECCNICP